jgi:hypothetical protein
MVNEQQISELVAAYLARHPNASVDWRGGVYWAGQRPSTEELSKVLLADAQAQALALGDLLRTPRGQVIEAGVAMVIPVAYAVDFKLFVEALTLASREQQRFGRNVAGAFALVAVALFGLALITR